MEKDPHITDFNVGYDFVPISFRLSKSEVDLYLKSVAGHQGLYEEHGYVPPTAMAAFALRGILLEINLPGGAIHSAQELTVHRPISSTETIEFIAKLIQNAVWKGWRFVSVQYYGLDAHGDTVINGRSTVVIAEVDL